MSKSSDLQRLGKQVEEEGDINIRDVGESSITSLSVIFYTDFEEITVENSVGEVVSNDTSNVVHLVAPVSFLDGSVNMVIV